MIIRCSRCGTRYRLPAEKIKARGTKVRCVRCRKVFLVKPEEEAASFEEVFESREAGEKTLTAGKTASSEAKVSGGLFQGVPRGSGGVTAEKKAGEQPSASKAGAPVSGPVEGLPENAEPENEISIEDLNMDGRKRKELSLEADTGGESPADESQSEERPPASWSEDEAFGGTSYSDASSPGPPTRKRSLVGRLLLVLFFLAVIFCSALVGFLFWRGESFDIASIKRIFREPAVEAPQPARKIHLQDVTSFYVLNQEAGQLFVVSGTAVNEFTQARSNLSVRVILYDENGRELRQQTVFCGNPFTKEALTDMPYRTIEENMHNQFGTTFSNLNIAPGKEIPFAIVFRNLPENLAEFSVEVVGSKAAGE
jgi:predicted Zn finger-like uncharacterized protein